MSSRNSSSGNEMDDDQFTRHTDGFMGLMLVLYAMGIAGNAGIIAVTFRTSSILTSKSNYLIAILAGLEFLMNVCAIGVTGLVLLDNMTVEKCFYIILPYLFTMNAGALMIVMIGLDRLLAMSLPLKYDKFAPRSYLIYMCTLPLLHTMTCIGIGYVSLPSEAVAIPQCLPPTALHGDALTYWIMSSLAIAVLVILIYSMAVYKASKLGFGGKSNSRAELMKHRTLQSLVIIMGVYAGSWFFTVAILALVNVLDLSPSLAFHITMFVGVGSGVNASCNAYIYFARSIEYRAEFRRLVRGANRVTVMTTSNNATNNMNKMS